MRAVRADEPARLQFLGPAVLVLQLDGGTVRRVVEGGEPDALLDGAAERGEPMRRSTPSVSFCERVRANG